MPIKTAQALITPAEKMSKTILSQRLERNDLAHPYLEEVKTLKLLIAKTKKAEDFLSRIEFRPALLVASGLAEAQLESITKEDETRVVERLVVYALKPAGRRFKEELIYRYLLTKSHAFGERTRTMADTFGLRKFLRALLTVLNLYGIPYKWKDAMSNTWLEKPKDSTCIEKRIKGLYWSNGKKHRLLVLNIAVPIVQKNVDLSILDGTIGNLKKGRESIIHDPAKYLALGELKGGMDPAGADEHWKTANSALNRIKNSFSQLNLSPKTFFIGAAIENSMAVEIFQQLQQGSLNQAANLTNDAQLTAICDWVVKL